MSPSWRLLVLLCLQGGGEDLEAAGVGDVDAAASGGFCVGTGERNNMGYTGVASYRCVAWQKHSPVPVTSRWNCTTALSLLMCFVSTCVGLLRTEDTLAAMPPAAPLFARPSTTVPAGSHVPPHGATAAPLATAAAAAAAAGLSSSNSPTPRTAHFTSQSKQQQQQQIQQPQQQQQRPGTQQSARPGTAGSAALGDSSADFGADVDRNALFSKYKHTVAQGVQQAEAVRQQQQLVAQLKQELKVGRALLRCCVGGCMHCTVWPLPLQANMPTCMNSCGLAYSSSNCHRTQQLQ